jgi:aryl-alcohol dehydrogenase-like predicted oxidoreductase
MKYRKLGKSDIKVSEISLGCWTLGGPAWNPENGRPSGWAEVNEKEAIKAIHLALDKGVTHFDNADRYGFGRAEMMLSKALGPRTKEVIIASKVGGVRGTAAHAYQSIHIRHQCVQSLRNLNRDYLDIYYYHTTDFGPGDRYLDEAVDTLNRLKREGKVRLIGLCAGSYQDFLRLIPRTTPDVLQSWAQIMDDTFIREGSPVQKVMQERSLSFIAYGPLAQGLLLGKYDPKNPPKFESGDFRSGRLGAKYSAENLAKLEPKLDKLRSRFGTTTKDLARVALQYVLSYKEVACAIAGFRNSAQVEMNLAGADSPLSAEDVAYIREVFGNN